MDDKIEALLTIISVALEDNKFEKEDLLSHFFSIPLLLTNKFANNRELSNAIKFFQEVILYYIYESEFEYQFYDKALIYLNDVYINAQKRDENILDAIDEQIDFMEDLFITRTISTSAIIEHFRSLIANSILTDKNYFIANVANRIDADEKSQILSIIPGGKNGI